MSRSNHDTRKRRPARDRNAIRRLAVAHHISPSEAGQFFDILPEEGKEKWRHNPHPVRAASATGSERRG